jgi:hypothetical protein
MSRRSADRANCDRVRRSTGADSEIGVVARVFAISSMGVVPLTA